MGNSGNLMLPTLLSQGLPWLTGALGFSSRGCQQCSWGIIPALALGLCAVPFGLFSVLYSQVPLVTADKLWAGKELARSRRQVTRVSGKGPVQVRKHITECSYERSYFRTEQFEFAANLFKISLYLTSAAWLPFGRALARVHSGKEYRHKMGWL